MNNEINSLLNVTTLLKSKSDEISKLKGEDFNIFSILDLESRENKTHSNFLFELLNPDGRHNLKDAFLRLFFDQIDFRDVDFEVEKFAIYKEYAFADSRMDIVIESGQTILVIENKIFAPDQSQQLIRYRKFLDTKRNKNQKLLYLNLEGKIPSEQSALGLTKDVDYSIISYKTDIISWLAQCLKEVGDYPILRETVKQYVILLKKLTGQLTSQTMEEELFNAITKDDESFEAAKIIHDNFAKVKAKAYGIEVNHLCEALVSAGFSNGQLSASRSSRLGADGLFITFIIVEVEGIKYDLGINIELENNYYFFCIVEQDKNRHGSQNDNPKFAPIKILLDSKFEGLGACNAWNMGMSPDFKVVADHTFKITSAGNKSAYSVLAEKLFGMYELVTSF